MESVTLRGVFTWDGHERRTDRYGGIRLLQKAVPFPGDSPGVDLAPFQPFLGKRARVTAVVIEARKSDHVGDLFRQIFPSQPDVGEVVNLGDGVVVGFEHSEWPQMLFRREGVAQTSDDWMDPNKLYRLHHQTVDLTVTPLDA